MNDLLKFRSWLASRTLRVFGILGITAALDASFFEGSVGMFILQAFLTVANALPFVELTAEQGISVLVVLLSGIAAWLRAITSKPLSER